MGKKFFSLCMALVLCLGLLPVTALAAAPIGQVIYVGNENVTNGGYWTTDSAGTVTAFTGEGTPADNFIYYDASRNTLTLHNATIRMSVSIDTNTLLAGAAIGVLNQYGAAELTITLEGTNTIANVGKGIYVLASSKSTGDASLTITSESGGSLDASASQTGIWVQSNSGNATLTIRNAKVEATGTSTAGYGVNVQSSNSSTAALTVDGGSLTASGSPGILYDSIGSGTVPNTTTLTISKSAIVDAREGGIGAGLLQDLKEVSPADDSVGIVFDGDDGTVYGSVTLKEDLTIGEGESLTIGQDASLNTGSHEVIVNGGTLTGEVNGQQSPQITTPPQSQIVTEGTQAAFSVSATAGSETPTYQWQQSTDNGGSWTDISGATEASYTISSTTTSMSGNQYRCVVKSASGVSVISSAATLTVTAKPAYTVTVNANPTEGGTANADRQTAAEAETVTLTATPNSNYRFVGWTSDGGVTFADASSLSTTFTMPAADTTITANWQYDPPYIPPTKPDGPSTGTSDGWEGIVDELADAEDGDTITIDMNGETEVPGEIFEEVAGKDVTVEFELEDGISWTVNGQDIPTATDFSDLDLGVDMGTSGISANVINNITGEYGSVQITLAHDGEFGFTLTLTAPLGRENAGSWANLYHYDEDAEALNYETSAEIQKDGTASLKMTHASQYAIIIDDKSHDLPFTDLGEGQWYESAVRYAYLHDIMEGMSATTFQPNGTLSRAMAVQIFYNLEGQPDISDENLGYPYEDVNAQAWYGDAVYWARITGVATGYGDGTFQPTDSITRQEFAQMLYNYAKYKGYDLSAEGDLSTFPDANSIADWAEIAMSWANGNELINGHDDGTIDAAGIGTRAQAASILMRFDQNLVEK